MEVALLVVALAFAVANGVNDGGAMVAVGLQVRGIAPIAAIGLLTAGVIVTPLVLGTRVATTLAERLVTFDGPTGQAALLVAVITAVAVPTLLARRGLPTSLTLAVVGAITGAGAGSGLEVSWGVVGVVLLLAAIAPVAGALGARILSWTFAAIGARTPIQRRVRRWHLLGFGSQCVAYGLNDGQKMLAVIAVATGISAGGAGTIAPPVWQAVAIGGCFLVGAVLGLPRVAATLTRGVVPVQPPAAVVSELASATVVLATGAVGSPVSMTQAVSGALVGTVSTGVRVRWREAARLVGAWAATLPAAAILAGGVAAGVRTLT